ncbi:MAG: RNB domain-containing ribonuclease [Verrucomicrobia bacterium]|nr:MAG: RNB domain-containing ribonuclease [Verrucomicrobiota bacterium]
MTFRAPLLEILRTPGYRPSNDSALFRQLKLHKKLRARFLHELRLLLSKGEILQVHGDRYALPAPPSSPANPSAPEAQTAHPTERQIFKITPKALHPAKAAPTVKALKTPARSTSKPASSTRKTTPAALAPTTPEVAPPASTEPLAEGELIGRLNFRGGGSAWFVPSLADDAEPDANRLDSIQIGREDTLNALPGDTVIVQIDASLRGKRFAKGDARNDEARGRVIRVITRARTQIVGRLAKIRSQYVVLADDPRFPLEVLVSDPALARLAPAPKPDDKVVVSLEPWHDPRKPLRGIVTERLGKTFEPRAELLGVYRKFNLDPTFPVEVEREVADLADTVPTAQIAGRLDYRASPVFTIDPDDAKDFDDALSIEPLPKGGLRIGIHIADVSAYVKPGTALDKEALKRGNSTYLVGTVVPMLPEKLSNGLCSLVEAQDRLCKAVFLDFDAKGCIQEKHTSYAATVIRSYKRLTYKQAYALLFGDDLRKIRELPLPPKHQTGSTGRALASLSDQELSTLQGWIRKLWKIASKLRADRMAHGSLDLDMPETKVFVDAEGYADRLERIEHDESHQLIEEFMLAANEAVARLTRREKLPSIYRVHDDPDGEKLDELRQQLAVVGIRVGDLTDRKELVRLLKLLNDHPQGYTLRTQLLRSLHKAAYRSSPDGHFGLHKTDYTHFTSPIRRYSDLVVHRVLEAYLSRQGSLAVGAQAGEEGKKHRPAPKTKLPYTAGKAQEMGEHLSLTEINSAEAERESVKIKLLEYFERELLKKKPTTFEAVITDVRPNGLFIELTESMTFGFLPASLLRDDYYQITADGTALVGGKKKKRYALAAKIQVHVAKVDRVKRFMDFRPAE